MFRNFQEIREKARSYGGKRIVVAGAEGESVLEAVERAYSQGIMEPILVGNREKIEKLADRIQVDVTRFTIEDKKEELETAHHAVSLVDSGRADGLMKGKVSSPVLLKAVLDKRYRLRSGRLLSHIALLEIPMYPKLLLMTDGGMVIRPDLEQKVQILRNAAELMRALGVKRPKVVVLAAIEKVSPEMPETEHGHKLQEMARNGELGELEVEGPLATDVAFSQEAAKKKGIESRIAGEPDICLMPDIASGNIFAKGLWHLAGAKIGGLVLGASKPIILLSRSDDAETKLNSIALGVVGG
jgi:phosphate butyryltransferase